MPRDVERQMLAVLPNGTLRAGADAYQLYVLEAARVDRDWFVRMAVVGRREHTLDIRVRADSSHSVTAQRVLARVRDFLLDEDPREDVFLEVPGIRERAC